MTNPRHLWSGDWREESARARRAAEEAAAQQHALHGPRPETSDDADAAGADIPDAPDAAGRGTGRSPTRAVVVLSVLVLALGTYALGTITGGDDGNSVGALPAVGGTPIKPKKGQTQAAAIYAAASPAVVSIRNGTGSGTGFLIDRNGTLVTNAHVVETSKHVTVRFGDHAVSLDGTVRGKDASSDLAVVDVDPSGIPKGVKPLQLADSRTVQVGDTAIAIGNPFGLDRTATEGIVSAVNRQITSPNGFQIDSVIQTDAAINPGNSGGPLLDDAGHVIGVNSQIEGGTGGNVGVGFAVPSNSVRQVAPQLEHGKTIKRAFLGLKTSDPIQGGTGAEIQSIIPGGPAENGKLRTGDVIKKIDGTEIKSSTEVAGAIATKQPGDKVTVTVERNGLTEEVTVKLGTRPNRTP
jgi:putative serine protease PepD